MGVLSVVVAAIGITGATICPTPGEIAARLGELVPDAGAPAREQVVVAGEAGALTLELRDAGGRSIARRRLEPAACDELAQAAAVVIAAWATDIKPDGAPEVVLPRARPPSKVGFELAGGFVASLAGGTSFAPGGELALTLGGRRSRVLGRLAFDGFATRNLAVGNSSPAHVSYTRASVGLGPVVRFRPSRFLFDLHAEASLALSYVAGIGYARSQLGYDADVGLGGGARAAVRLGWAAPFLAASVVGWLRPTTVIVTGPGGGSPSLPAFELWLSAGIGFGNY